MSTAKAERLPHPIVWLILYLPFGALAGFVSVALTFLATKNGLSIGEGSLIIGSQLLVNWLKWIWAPLVDITWTPKRWYVTSTLLSGVGVFATSAIPLGPQNLVLLLCVIAAANIINSIVGMSTEAMISSLTPPDQVGRVSAWFQAGNLGGGGLGGALGLFLIQHLPKPWMSGAIMGVIFSLCCLALLALPSVPAHEGKAKPMQAIRNVFTGFWFMLRERAGTLTAILCLLPVGTGAAQGTLTQAAVAGHWGAGAEQVELTQGLLAGFITAIGCFFGGWICNRMRPYYAYAAIGIFLAAVAAGMAYGPATVTAYLVFNMIYSFGVGLAYSAFTAMVLIAIGHSAAATGYNVYASLSNFPIWWMGLLLGYTADHYGARNMLLTEAILGVLGVVVFVLIARKYSGERA